MAGKRKRTDEAQHSNLATLSAKRRSSARSRISTTSVNPDLNAQVLDAPDATRASPDSDVNDGIVPEPTKLAKEEDGSENLPNGSSAAIEPRKKTGKAQKGTTKSAASKTEREGDATTAMKGAEDVRSRATIDHEAESGEEADEEEVQEALSRSPPVNSDYLPLPWKGRLGFACLNTYLRNSNPPVFSSRTCRIQSILEHRHPLQDPTQPESNKNKPDRTKPADISLGQRYVESLGLANVQDIAKMCRWNNRYNIKFFRLSSEMFPFASHPEYGYKLAPFASEALAEAGKVIAELGHRVTTHPGQFTQLGSPRKPVIENAIRDLEYHDEMLSLLKLPEQLNRDAVMILHMGGIFEGKAETLQRFKEYYADLSDSVKRRLVLENDDMGWSVHDLLPICEELNIPLVLDFHHHNIVFDAEQIREGTKDIIDLFPRIKATWDRKSIKQKMHYSEPTPAAITPRQRRKHNPRVATLPPCPPDMDLMIEAKDKEQAVFELMRTFKLPGYETFNDILPYIRNDDNKAALAAMNRKKRTDDEAAPVLIADEDVGMGGSKGRVYWPPGMEEWLRPKKRETKKKEPKEKTLEQKKEEVAVLYAAREAEKNAMNTGNDASEHDSDPDATPATKKAKVAMRKKAKADADKAAIQAAATEVKDSAKAEKQAMQKPKGKAKKQPQAQTMPTPNSSGEVISVPELNDDRGEGGPVVPRKKRAATRVGSRRAGRDAISYKENEEDI